MPVFGVCSDRLEVGVVPAIDAELACSESEPLDSVPESPTVVSRSNKVTIKTSEPTTRDGPAAAAAAILIEVTKEEAEADATAAADAAIWIDVVTEAVTETTAAGLAASRIDVVSAAVTVAVATAAAARTAANLPGVDTGAADMGWRPST